MDAGSTSGPSLSSSWTFYGSQDRTNLFHKMNFTVCLVLVGFALAMILGCLHILIWWTQDKAEPPVLGNSIPFLTPILGILKERTNYMVQLRDSHPDVALYTLRLPGSRTYVVNSPSLVPLLQRQKRTIAFEPIPVQAAANIMGVSSEGLDIIGRDCTEDHAYFGSFLKATHPALAPGAGLESIQNASVKVLAAGIDRLEATGTTIEVDLWHWSRHEMLQATTEAIYGPGNPFRDLANERAYYEFENGIMLQMLQVHNLFAQGRSSLHARELLVRAFQRYFADGNHCSPDTSSLCLVQARHKHNLSHGLCPEDIARTEIGQVAASLSNTIPGAFWMVWHVLSDPVVLASCREEFENLVTVETVKQMAPDGRVVETEVCTLDCSQLTNPKVCPIANSTWQEVLRFNHVGTAARVVMQDNFLGGYLLKKGSTAVVVSPVMHSDVSVWGPSAATFDHRRFLVAAPRSPPGVDLRGGDLAGHGGTKPAQTGRRTAGGNLAKSPANRNFGGGSTLCPGRYLATQAVLSLLALTILRFDVRPVGGKPWRQPRRGVPGPTSMPIPEPVEANDLRVEMVPRFPERKWRIVFRGSHASGAN